MWISKGVEIGDDHLATLGTTFRNGHDDRALEYPQEWK